MPVDITKTFNFHLLSILANAPHESGVYAIFNAQQWIYVGESGDLQARLLEHLNGSDTTAISIKSHNPTGFLFELVPAVARLGRQNQLISELRPVCNQKLG